MPTPVIVTAQELTVEYGEQKVLTAATLSIHELDRIGLVGRNGAGKSTFLKIISGIMEPDSGNVIRKKNLRSGFLSQEFTLSESKTVHDNILEGASHITALLDAYQSLPPHSEERHALEVQISTVDGWDLERKITILSEALHVPASDKIVSLLSGGERRRVALCKTLISQPELLILDEPTNHLDTDSIEWIENFLADYKGTCIFVTHDRYFLDRIANRIVELSNGTFYSHQGNYTDYLMNQMQRQAQKETEERKRQNFLRRELTWVMTGPRARRTKAKSRLDAYYEIAEQKIEEAPLDVDLIIPPAEKLGMKVLELQDVSFAYHDTPLFSMLNFNFEPGRRLGIVGKNGVGKTTLLRLILGQLTPSSGQIIVGEKTEYNYVDQSRMVLNDEDTVLTTISDGGDYIRFGKQQMLVWTYLRRFLFTDDRIHTKVGKLSGGERSRLTLAKILKDGGNFLILDEPTNDLDLPTLRILEEALIGFEGCVIIVSHDRYFLNRVCTGILGFEGNGVVHFSEGDYDYYHEKKLLRSTGESQPGNKEKKEDTRQKPKKTGLTWKESKELESIEAEISAAEEEVTRIEQIFAMPDFYSTYAAQTESLKVEHELAKERVTSLYDRWQFLEEKKNS